MKGIKYPCRIYAFESNMSGRDDYQFQAVVDNDEELFRTMNGIRDAFHDNYTELDKFVYLTDEKEERLNVRPSSVLKKFGGEEEKKKAAQIRRCEFCFHHVDKEMNYCKCFGKIGCGRYITINDFWRSEEGKKEMERQEEEERKYWEAQPSEEREFHELYEQYSRLLNKWWNMDESRKAKVNPKMDELARRLGELHPDFTDWRF